jgi:hypothetical protein
LGAIPAVTPWYFTLTIRGKRYTWGTSHADGFHGVYLGDLERLQAIQRKRDVTNRDWQRIILRKVGTSLGWDMEQESIHTSSSFAMTSPTTSTTNPLVLETRQLWWQIHNKMRQEGYSNMVLLVKMEDALEKLMYERKQKYITKARYEQMVDQIHLDTEGCVVDPLVALADRQDREQREKIWYENLALEMEEECLIK